MADEGRDVNDIGLGRVVTNDHGTRFLIVAMYPRPRSLTLPEEARVFGLVRIPTGMGPLDLGRRFQWAPTPEDATRPELI